MFKDNFTIYYKISIQCFLVYILGLMIFTCSRTAFLLTFGNFQELNYYKTELLYAYWTGFRYDAAALSYGFSVIAVLNLLILLMPYGAETFYEKMKKYIFWYIISLYFAVLVILFVDYFYFLFFHSHLNAILFGIFDGGARAVLTSVWTDYPVVSIVAVVGIIMSVLAYVVRKIFAKGYGTGEKRIISKISFVALTIGIYVLPLSSGRGEVFVSSNLFLNDLALNGIVTLQKTLSSEKTKLGADGRPIRPVRPAFQSLDVYFAKTPSRPFLAKEPPNVIFIVMESMGNYYLDLHSPDLNLLGRLEKQLPHCLVFRNFLPFSYMSTIRAIEGLMLNYSNPQMRDKAFYLDMPLSSSVALPFLNGGYHTNFLTGQDLEWNNLGRFVSKQYFETVEGAETLRAELRGAKNYAKFDESGIWGVHDEFLFDRIFSKLENSKGKPQFIFALTISNHTPFDLPQSYRAYSIQMSSGLLKRLRINPEIAVRNLTSYQYANDCLGGFLEKLRNSPFGENTIVAATGDHYPSQLFSLSYTEQLNALSVPFIVYVPEKYLPKHSINTTHFASHKDIFPTLFNLSLSDARYFKAGNDLFDDHISESDLFAINGDSLIMSRDGYVITTSDKSLFYKWRKDNPKLLEPTTLQESPALGVALKRLKDYIAERNYYVMSEVLK